MSAVAWVRCHIVRDFRFSATRRLMSSGMSLRVSLGLMGGVACWAASCSSLMKATVAFSISSEPFSLMFNFISLLKIPR
jgi:hypothetical protein